MTIWREDGAGGIDEAVGDARDGVQERERRQAVEEIAQRDIHTRDNRRVGGCFEKIRESAARDELGEDRQLTRGRIALDADGLGEALVFERREPRDAVTDQSLERRQLRLDVNALEHLAGFAVEGQRPPPQAINVARRRDRRGRKIGR